MLRRLIPFVGSLALASSVIAGDTAFSVCVTNGENGQPAASVEVSVRAGGFYLTRGYTDSNGCFETDFVYSGDPKRVEFDFTSAHFLPWYGYPEFECEVLFPASPPFVACTGQIRLVPRMAPAVSGKFRLDEHSQE